MVAMVCFLYGSAHPALGAQDDLVYLVTRLREAWPRVQIHFRGDPGFGVPHVYDNCERFDLYYSIGIATNSRLKKCSESLLKRAVQQYEETGRPQRLFCALWYKADA